MYECGVETFHQSLEAPLLKYEVLAEERIRERRAALMRGDIPA